MSAERPSRVVLFTDQAACDHCGWSYPARLTLSSEPEEAIATCALVVLVRCRCGATKPIGIPAKATDVVAAAANTALHARTGKVCGAQSKPLPGFQVYAYCTRERKHEGEHVATSTTGLQVARWSA